MEILKNNIKIFMREAIEAVDIVILFGYTKPKAWAAMREMRVLYNKPRPQSLTFNDLKKYKGISDAEIVAYLKFVANNQQ